MPYIKNIEHEKVVDLAGEVQYMPGQVVSKTLAQNEAVSVTLFAFEKGEEIGTHDSKGDAMVTVLDGVGEIYRRWCKTCLQSRRSSGNAGNHSSCSLCGRAF